MKVPKGKIQNDRPDRGGVKNLKSTAREKYGSRAMQVKTVNALTQGEDRRQRSGVSPVDVATDWVTCGLPEFSVKTNVQSGSHNSH